MAKGKGTLLEEVQDLKEQNVGERIADLRGDLKTEITERRSLADKVARLQERFNDERVSTAKSLGAAAVGGGGTAGLIEVIMYLVQSGGG